MRRLACRWKLALQPQDLRRRVVTQVLTSREGKGAALYLKKWLKEAIRKEGLPLPKARFKPGTPPCFLSKQRQQLIVRCGTHLHSKP